MASLNQQLIGRKEELETLLNQIEEFLRGAPEGRLRISHNKKTTTYYLCGCGTSATQKKSGIYLGRNKAELIKELAQKGYLQQAKKEIEKQLTYLNRDFPDLSNSPIIDISAQLSDPRKQLITPLLEDDDVFIANWQSCTYNRRTFPLDAPEYITERGERVLSKSEKILADKFFRMNIPYHYEKPLNLNGYGWVRPDFTLLNVRTREEFYWEHLGMIELASYAEENAKRLNAFIKNGILPGKQLILTWETKGCPLDWRVVEKLINEYLI